jgi:hypothetical protein
MPDSPKERRRRARAAASAPEPNADKGVEAVDRDDDDDDASPPESPRLRRGAPPRTPASASTGRPRIPGNAVWPLVAGLAVGFVVGRESHRFGGGDTKSGDATGEGPTAAALDDKAAKHGYASQAAFPDGWVKEAAIGNAGTLFAGLTEAQKATVLQALNERNCECGCGMGSLALCLSKDPNCPRSPAMAKLAADLVKQGKSAADIEAAIDAKQKEMAKPAAAPAAEPPSGPRKVELAAWNPRKGPKAAKVTLVEFSDFQ